MPTVTSIPRYDKNQILRIDGKEISLIDYLSQIRIPKKITKKKISNLIKHNDYWYSQIEHKDKQGNDNRQRTIYRPDLIDIVSIIVYNASTSFELKDLKNKSEIYIDKVLKAVPLKNSVKPLEMYQLNPNRSPEEQDRLFSSLLSTQTALIKDAYASLSGVGDKDIFLNCLKNIVTNMRIDPLFIIYISGLSYMDFLYEAKQEEINELFNEIMKTLDQFTINLSHDEKKKINKYYVSLESKLHEITHCKKLIENRPFPYEVHPDEDSDI